LENLNWDVGKMQRLWQQQFLPGCGHQLPQ